METNNKLREALTKILNLTNSLDEDCAVDPVEIRDITKATLAAPDRNCDVGTAEEQAARMRVFCAKNGLCHDGAYRCENCELLYEPSCELTWAQMPYESEAAK